MLTIPVCVACNSFNTPSLTWNDKTSSPQQTVVLSTPLSGYNTHYDDSMTITYNLDPNFAVDIPTKEDYKEVEPINHNINCHTDASKLDDTGLEQVCLSTTVIMALPKKQFISAKMRLCFKLKYSQWEEQHPTLYSPKQKKECCHQLR